MSVVRQEIPVGDGFDAVLICIKTMSSQSGYELDDTDVTQCKEVLVFLFLFIPRTPFTDIISLGIKAATRIPLLILARFHSFIFPLLL